MRRHGCQGAAEEYSDTSKFGSLPLNELNESQIVDTWNAKINLIFENRLIGY